MASELSVTVSIPGEKRSVYHFDEPVISIGRLPECNLSICHEAVSRKLCSVWLEDEGHKVRLEERPNLTNPIISNEQIIKGGIEGKKIKISVGPVKLSFEPVNMYEENKKSPKKMISKPYLTAGLGILVLIVALNMSFSGLQNKGGEKNLNLPSTPFDEPEDIFCDSKSSCKMKGEILLTRALEISSNPESKTARKVHGVNLLLKSRKFFKKSGDVKFIVPPKLVNLSKTVTADYQRHVLNLKLSLRKKNAKEAAREAKILIKYLQNKDSSKEKLQKILNVSGRNK